jgi:hypothetical protein
VKPAAPVSFSSEVAVAKPAAARLNPWRSLWRHPRRTVRWLVDHDPKRFVLLLGALMGMIAPPQAEHPWASVLFSAFVGPWLTLAMLFVRSRCDAVMGGWLGGSAATGAIRCANAWSNLPAIVAGTAALGISLIGARAGIATAADIVGSVLLLVGAVWTLVVYVIMFAELEEFSIKRAVFSLLGSWILSLVMIVGPIVAAILLYSAVAG